MIFRVVPGRYHRQTVPAGGGMEMTGTSTMTSTETGTETGTTELSDFDELTKRYQRELLAHCYRMTGSVHEAEDLVQETLLRAWKAQGGYEGRASVRTWLYRIATNVCLTNLEGKPRRPMPTGLGTSSSDAHDPLETSSEIPWLEPIPDAAVLVGEKDTRSEERRVGKEGRARWAAN